MQLLDTSNHFWDLLLLRRGKAQHDLFCTNAIRIKIQRWHFIPNFVEMRNPFASRRMGGHQAAACNNGCMHGFVCTWGMVMFCVLWPSPESAIATEFAWPEHTSRSITLSFWATSKAFFNLAFSFCTSCMVAWMSWYLSISSCWTWRRLSERCAFFWSTETYSRARSSWARRPALSSLVISCQGFFPRPSPANSSSRIQGADPTNKKIKRIQKPSIPSYYLSTCPQASGECELFHNIRIFSETARVLTSVATMSAGQCKANHLRIPGICARLSTWRQMNACWSDYSVQTRPFAAIVSIINCPVKSFVQRISHSMKSHWGCGRARNFWAGLCGTVAAERICYRHVALMDPVAWTKAHICNVQRRGGVHWNSCIQHNHDLSRVRKTHGSRLVDLFCLKQIYGELEGDDDDAWPRPQWWWSRSEQMFLNF